MSCAARRRESDRKGKDNMAHRLEQVKTSFFGKGAIRLIIPQLQKMQVQRALIVTDRFLFDCGAAGRVGDVLLEAGVSYAVYYNVKPNPSIDMVMNVSARH